MSYRTKAWYLGIPFAACAAFVAWGPATVPTPFWLMTGTVTGVLIAAMIATLMRLHTDRQTRRADAGKDRDPITAQDLRAEAELRLRFLDLITSNIVVAFILGALTILAIMGMVLFTPGTGQAASHQTLIRVVEAGTIFALVLFGCTAALVFSRLAMLIYYDFSPSIDGD